MIFSALSVAESPSMQIAANGALTLTIGSFLENINMRTMMNKTIRSSLAVILIALSAIPLSWAAQARSSFDGRWHVEAVADPGKCSDKYSVAISVANGQIS